MGSTTWEGMIMHIALDVNVQVKDDTLVLTDRAGKTITFSKEQTVQKKVSMIALGELWPPQTPARHRLRLQDTQILLRQPQRCPHRGTARPLAQTDGAPHPIKTHQGGRGPHHPHAFRDR